ncbi:sulfonate transport system permease protein [Rhodoblastus acidophilus]|uniref:Sulfonate transport system permease protein n=1 Tax=Rhodoblastus acidophilus TaxID=1074 RepID=A0A212SGP9_RHOAC|nr:ABC transporter permease subunit [Rhodoblastus acidophilus]PPQ36801.1 ABC transporter permease [Rhodoblastus acidophilus]RAI16499.1 ABC transporter permease [Rhodoblastus acidophilus]SNB84935.1 sulfonate transport system permease protein [Rhodoblastus acidophilus]
MTSVAVPQEEAAAPIARSRGSVRGSVLPWLAPLALLAAWQASAAYGSLSQDVLPSPLAVVEAGWRLLLSGLLIGGGIGFVLGLANGLSKLSEDLTDTTLQMIRNVAHLALMPLMPLVILWFGIDESAKLFLVALGTFFPVYINTFHGARSVDPQLIEMGRSYGLSRMSLFRQIVLPGALPSIFVGLRFALGVMWLTLIVAETIAAQSGIGYIAMQAREFLQLDVVVLGILIYAALGKLADVVARLLERRMLRWRPFQKRCGRRPAAIRRSPHCPAKVRPPRSRARRGNARRRPWRGRSACP